MEFSFGRRRALHRLIGLFRQMLDLPVLQTISSPGGTLVCPLDGVCTLFDRRLLRRKRPSSHRFSIGMKKHFISSDLSFFLDALSFRAPLNYAAGRFPKCHPSPHPAFDLFKPSPVFADLPYRRASRTRQPEKTYCSPRSTYVSAMTMNHTHTTSRISANASEVFTHA